MAVPITLKKSTGSNHELVVTRSTKNTNITPIASIRFICDETSSSVNLFCGALPTRYPLSLIISSILLMALCVSLLESPFTNVTSITALLSL